MVLALRQALTEDQKKVQLDIIEWFNSDRQFHLLSGSAGVGKSFLIAELIKTLAIDNPGFKVGIFSPTNKATGVLHDLRSENNLSNVYVATVYSALHLQPSNNYTEDGQQIFMYKPTANPHLSEFHFVVIDEISMISEELLGHILRGKGTRQKILLVGDKCQLPPVEVDDKDSQEKSKVKLSPVYDLENCHISHLTKPLRYAGDIALFAKQLRDRIIWHDVAALIKEKATDEKIQTQEINEYTEDIIKNYTFSFKDYNDGADHFFIEGSHKDIRGRITKITKLPRVHRWKKPDTEFFLKL
jgi:hypothetical protein